MYESKFKFNTEPGKLTPIKPVYDNLWNDFGKFKSNLVIILKGIKGNGINIITNLLRYHFIPLLNTKFMTTQHI